MASMNNPRGGGVGAVPPRFAGVMQPSQGQQARPEPKRIAVIACMDPRLRLEAALGVAQGQASWIRNAGGTVSDDALFALKAAYDLFGAREFVVVGHNDCAFARNEGGGLDTSGAEHVRAQVQKLRLSSGVPRDVVVRGFVYSLATNRVAEVDGAAPARPGPVTTAPAPGALPVTRAAPVASQAETRRVRGRLEREPLMRMPSPPSVIQRSGPTADDFRRKVAEMTAGEPEALNALDAVEERRTREAAESIGLSMRARDIVRSVILGEVLDRPKAQRGRANGQHARRDD